MTARWAGPPKSARRRALLPADPTPRRRSLNDVLWRMLRRKPTRLELKLDDIEEFEGARKDLESRKKQREEVDVIEAGDSEAALGLSNDHKSREQMIHDRIGYKPQPKPNNRSSQFGNFEF